MDLCCKRQIHWISHCLLKSPNLQLGNIFIFSATEELHTSAITPSCLRWCRVFWNNVTKSSNFCFERLASTWVYPQYICYSAGLLVSTENNTHSHLLVLGLVHCLRTHSWNTALGMTSHTDRSRNCELLHQTLSDGTAPVQLNCTGHIWFWNKHTIFIHLWHKCEGTSHINVKAPVT